FSKDMISGAVGSYFSDHFTRQLKAASMVQDFLGLCPKPSKRVEGGGATGGLCFQSAWEAVASGRMECCVAFGFETMSRVNTWKGNEFIALASDTNFDFPVGGFYSGYYAMMVQRHMYEFGTTVEQMAMVSVKNHANALYNPYAQKAKRLTVKEVRESPMVATPLTMEDICTMSDGAAVCILASEDLAGKVCDRPVRISGVGSGSDAMRMADRPHGNVILLPHELESDYRDLKYPGVHSIRGSSRLRASGRCDRPHAGGLRVLAIATYYGKAFGERHVASEECQARTHTLARWDRNIHYRFNSRGSVAMEETGALIIHDHY